jgi:oligoribonuclease (3'-5' exoribonuclease)
LNDERQTEKAKTLVLEKLTVHTKQKSSHLCPNSISQLQLTFLTIADKHQFSGKELA